MIAARAIAGLRGTRPVAFRKGMDGLALAVQEMIGLDPLCGAAFVFRAKPADRINILIWDRTGMVLVHKRLESGAFVWPQVQDGRHADVAGAVLGPVQGDRLAAGPAGSDLTPAGRGLTFG